MEAFWWEIADDPDAFPPSVLKALLEVQPYCVGGGECRPVYIEMTGGSCTPVASMRQWRPRLEEVKLEVRQFGVAVPGRVEHGRLGAAPHETNSWLILADCSNGCNTVNRIAVLAGDGPLRVDILAVCGQVIWQEISWCAILDGRRESTGRSLVPEGCSKGHPYGTADYLLVVAAWAEACPCEVREGRS